MKQAASLDNMMVNIDQTIEIKAAPGDVFEGLVTRICELYGEEGKPPLKLNLERWPGGRWFRELEGGNGHLWGFVQAIRPPTLLELYGPMFMSYPVAGHMIIRLSPVTGGTRVVLQNQFFGPMPPEMHDDDGMATAWNDMLNRLKKDSER